jgi:hypothetical protein
MGITAVILFVLGLWQHYSMFPYEYQGGYPIKELLKDYSPFIMTIAVILSGFIAVMVFYGGNPPSVSTIVPASVSSVMPNLGMPNLTVRPANNAGKSILGSLVPGNNSKRSNIASTSFKVV